VQISEQIGRAEAKKLKDLAFLGWQMQAPFRETPISYDDYCKQLFKEEEKLNPEDVVTPEKAIENADRILDMFKEKGGEKVDGLI
jgi:hypothetical protein